MRLSCIRRRRSIVDRELGRLAPTRQADLERHLASCPDCAQAVVEESALSARLRSIDRAMAPVVDVRARVLVAIAGRRPSTDRPPVGWATGLGLLGASALVGFSLWAWPDLLLGLGEARALFAAFLSILQAALGVILAAGAWVLGLAFAAARALGALAPLVRALAPVVAVALVIGACAATGTIAVAVAHDLARGSRLPLREER